MVPNKLGGAIGGVDIPKDGKIAEELKQHPYLHEVYNELFVRMKNPGNDIGNEKLFHSLPEIRRALDLLYDGILPEHANKPLASIIQTSIDELITKNAGVDSLFLERNFFRQTKKKTDRRALLYEVYGLLCDGYTRDTAITLVAERNFKSVESVRGIVKREKKRFGDLSLRRKKVKGGEGRRRLKRKNT